MFFSKENLLGQDYSWQATGTDIFIGTPSRRIFNRFNGNQVLFLINFYSTLVQQFSIKEAQKLEERLLNELPLGTQSELSVIKWLQA